MKRYVKAASEYDHMAAQEFCKNLEQQIQDSWASLGLAAGMAALDLYIKPAGSGYRVTVQLPRKHFHGQKWTDYFYKRDADQIVRRYSDLSDDMIDYLNAHAAELTAPVSRSSTAEAVSEGRNSTDPNRLQQLAQHSAKSVRRAVLRNPNTPPDAKLSIYESDGDPDYSMRLSTIPIDMLVDYHYKHPDDMRIFKGIMGSSRTPEHVIRELFDEAAQYAGYDSPLFQLVVKRNDLPEDIYYKLAELDDTSIDWNLIVNRGVPMELVETVLDRHSDDPQFAVRIKNRRYY